jgi:hypothetical protein
MTPTGVALRQTIFFSRTRSPFVDPDPWSALEESLALLGLDPRRARLYVILVTRGPLRASELAEAARMQRTEAYRAMEELLQGGFARASLERPTRYVAVPPASVWDQALASHRARTALLESGRSACLAALADIAPPAPSGPIVLSHRILSGRETIYETVEAMITGARRDHCMVSSALVPEQVTLSNRPFRATMLRARDGLPMRLVFPDSPGLGTLVAPFIGLPNVEIRTFSFPAPLRLSIVDRREVVQWLASDASPRLDAKGDVAMMTNAPEFLATQTALFEALWARATPWQAWIGRRIPLDAPQPQP